jgi:hypothetical protein
MEKEIVKSSTFILGYTLMGATDITITLPFVRTLHSSSPLSSPAPVASQFAYQRSPQPSCAPREDTQINTQAPFPLRGMYIDVLTFTIQRLF